MFSRLTPLVAALSLAGIALPALAEAETELGRIEVTGTRLASRAIRPVNLTVLSSSDIEHSTATSLPELLAGVAGVTMRNSDSTGNGSIDLRGFGASGASNTLILLDGVKLNDNDLSSPQLTVIALNRLERIEIVRGGSVAWGGGSSGGVINLITRRDTGADIQLGVGSHARRQLLLGGGLRQGAFSLRADGRHEETDGYRDNGRNKLLAGAAQFGWQDERSRLELGLAKETEELRFPGPNRVNPATGLNEFIQAPWSSSTPKDWGKTEGERLTLHGEGKFEGGRWALDGSRRGKDTDAYFDYGGFPSRDRRESHENRFSPRLGLQWGGLEVAGGIDIGRAHTERYSGSLVASDLAGTSRLHTEALWVDLGYAVQAGSRLTVGARHERASQTVLVAASPWSPAMEFKRDDAPNALQLGWRQHLSADLWWYARVGQSYRLANADELVGNSELRSQRSRDFELGTEARLGEGKLRVSAFSMRLRDEIAFQPYVNGFGANINLAPTRRQGMELEWSQKIGELDLAANMTWLDARFRGGVYGGKDVTGKQVPLVPRLQGNLSLGWAWSDATRLDGQLHAVSHSRIDNDQINTGPWLAGYGTVDLKLSHRVGGWQLALSGQNLGDKRYASYGVKSTSGANYNLYPMPGRRWFASAGYRW
ncbi:TonB-dependent receptor [Chitinimonas arctica]|uniref:TonB-dependent receptor n=1 Tax=Chitinimonas arctica TaxID=2594795 RepID=A0A516SER3_9NEIS|nr:TonB-dependent receptor [Chitinimonas arctica]QDQ26647.1 TonB-dependent receptor [Chitinimonas arctica]